MGHPLCFNRTPFHFEWLPLVDDIGRSVLVGLVKASFRLRERSDGPLIPLAEQLAFEPAGTTLPAEGGLCHRYEPEGVLPKPGTDLVLIGTARAPRPGLTSFDIAFRVGRTVRQARVFGDRIWRDTGIGFAISKPAPVDTIPLDFTRAFGGRDESALVGGHVPFEPRNPVGLGYHHPRGRPLAGSPLPNIERTDQPIRDYLDTPEPAGFGFVGPHWQPRIRYAGTYDAAWERDRKPWLPRDFDSRHHNAAASGLTLERRLHGDESVTILNASPIERLEFDLPGLANPEVHVERRGGRRERADTALDTIVVDTDEMVVVLYYRGLIVLPGGVHELSKLAVRIDGIDRFARLQSVV